MIFLLAAAASGRILSTIGILEKTNVFCIG